MHLVLIRPQVQQKPTTSQWGRLSESKTSHAISRMQYSCPASMCGMHPLIYLYFRQPVRQEPEARSQKETAAAVAVPVAMAAAAAATPRTGARRQSRHAHNDIIAFRANKHHQQPHRHHVSEHHHQHQPQHRHWHRRCKDNKPGPAPLPLLSFGFGFSFCLCFNFWFSFAFRGGRTRLSSHSRATRFADRTFQPCPVSCLPSECCEPIYSSIIKEIKSQEIL